MIEATAKPEESYRAATDKAERMCIRKAVVEAYRKRVTAYVRRTVPAAHVDKGLDAGLTGLLYALEAYEPVPACGADAFWFHAARFVITEVQECLDKCLVWVRRQASGGADAEVGVAFDADEIELSDGRLVSVRIKTVDGAPATRGEFLEAMTLARQAIWIPVED